MRIGLVLIGIVLFSASLIRADKRFAGLVFQPKLGSTPVETEALYWAYSWLPFTDLLKWLPSPPPLKAENVPLKSVDTKATIRGWAVDVHSVLTYSKNRYRNIECEFVFPIPDNAAVYKFEAMIGGRKLKAEVKKRSEAKKIYQDAVDSGQRAGLLESQEGSPDVYRILLGNMRAGEDAVVTLAYAMPIERDPKEGLLTVNLPVVLNPRYVPESDIYDPVIMSQKFHSAANYIAVSDNSYDFKFSADINLGVGGGNKILGIKSGNSNDDLLVSAENSNRTANVELISDFKPDHDFRLIIDTKQELTTNVVIEPGLASAGDTSNSNWLSYDVAAAWFEPIERTKSEFSKDQYWLVVDRSGSMWGEKITNAKSALIYFIKSLPVGCKFNIVGFGSTFDLAFQEIADYSDDTVAKAMDYANSLDASFGGTEILKPLQNVYDRPIPDGVDKNFIILLTDGEVSNTNSVIDLVRQNAGRTTVYSIGIGEGASTALVNGVARVSNGVSEYIRSSDDRLQAKVVDMLEMAEKPLATNVKLEWPENGFSVVDKVPTATKAMAMQGREVAQFVLIKRNLPTIVGVSGLSADFEGDLLKFSVPFVISGKSESDDPMPLHRLAAKAKLVELKDEYYARNEESLKDQAIGISLSTGVLSEFTSIVAVDDSGEFVREIAGNPLFAAEQSFIHDLPEDQFSDLAYSQAGHSLKAPLITAALSFNDPCPNCQMVHAPRKDSSPKTADPFAKDLRLDLQLENLMELKIRRDPPIWSNLKNLITEESTSTFSPSWATTLAKPSRASIDLGQLINLVTSSGAWKLDIIFGKAVGFAVISGPNGLKQALVTVTYPEKYSDEVLATLTGISVLRNAFPSKQGEWHLIEQKAENYLKTQGLTDKDVHRYVGYIAKILYLYPKVEPIQ